MIKKKLTIAILSSLIFALFAAIPVAHAEACQDINDAIGGFLDCGTEDVVSFVGFKSQIGLTGEGLDPELKKANNAREFIVNVVNFALGFLGLISLVIIIYGGFMYVTAAGNEEQAGKGKKAITYALIGIIIILASYAIVRTALTIGGGDETQTGGVRSSGVEGTNIGQQAVYSMGANEINTALNEFIAAYKNLAAVNGLLKRIEGVSPPATRAENRRYLFDVSGLVSEIKSNSNSLSKTSQTAQQMLDYLVTVQNKSEAELQGGKYEIEAGSDAACQGLTDKTACGKKDHCTWDNNKCVGSAWGTFAEGAADGGTSLLANEVINSALKKDFKIQEAVKTDFKNAIDSLIGTDEAMGITRPDTETVEGRLFIVWKIMGEVADSVTTADAIDRGGITDKDLSKAFAGIDPNTTVGKLFYEAIFSLRKASGEVAQSNTGTLNTDTLIKTVQDLNRLYLIVKDIKFVYVRIAASVRDGNAPLVVELNGLNSRDPAAQTIADDLYEWDQDGDGKPGVSNNSIDCGGIDKGPTVTCTYSQPGTYIVNLKIASKDKDHIAAGRATLSITVNPPMARIGLKATVGTSLNVDLRKYAQDTVSKKWNMLIDKSEFQVTTKEAKEVGVSFDAAETKGGDNQPVGYFLWSFGDNTQPMEGGTEKAKTDHKYDREGTFKLQLEVTDSGKRKDRKIVNVLVASIAARIGVNKNILEPEELAEFDGSLSRSDSGPINSYAWTIVAKDGTDVTNLTNSINVVGNTESPVLRVRFKDPGQYKVKLHVSDGSKSADAEIAASVRSRKPRADFAIKACPTACPDPTQPSLVEFDASPSFDPDPADNEKLNYSWKFLNSIGEEVSFGDQKVKKMRIKFKDTGKYKAALTVTDPHDETLRQEDIREKEVEIKSMVDAAWSPAMKEVMQLKEGIASFNVQGTVSNATRVQIDFGDGESSEQSVTPNPQGAGAFSFPHEYVKAGVFTVTATAISDGKSGENTITKRLYVSGGDAPMAVMNVSVDKNEVVLPDPVPGYPKPALEIIRNKPVAFDAGKSINSKGEANGLKFSWDFGDRGRSTGAKVEHSYQDVSPEDSPFTVTLTVTEERDPSKTNQTKFLVKVASKKPHVTALSLEKKTASQRTPIDVELKAEGAIDPDGRISNYQFWYYDPADKERKLSVMDSPTDHATLTVETNGAENEEHEYYFCVSVTDNENATSECGEMFDQSDLPKLKVKNGANKAPVASFSSDHTNIKVNEPVTFTSSSMDADGRIVKYVWDVDGDGFQNDNPTDLSTINHKYARKSPDSGYRVKLKVLDDKGAAGYSKEVPVFVATKSKAPTANFNYQVEASPPRRVKFFDTSVADTQGGAKLAKWTWDFDTSTELGCDVPDPKPAFCNGDKTDDENSTDQNPIFDFPASGSYQVKLTVEDSDGNVSEPKTSLINLIAGSSGGTGTSTPNSTVLKAELKTDPALKFEMDAIRNKQMKVLHIPSSSNGQQVTLFWGDSTGDVVSYRIDKNLWCDSSGEGNRSNDTDNPDTSGGNCKVASTGQTAENCWTTNYQRYAKTGHPKGPGHFATLLEVKNRATGATSTDTLEVVFDGTTDPNKVLKQNDCDGKPPVNNLGASLFTSLGIQNTILLGLASGVIVVLMGFGLAGFLRKGKTRV
ncbi:PKD domain-containing protein [Candidatus Peregrinibacteria bacterium]|nr:PKD domain-containing protein [Candidatus Peregrinibacteria bacterium]